MEQLIAWLEKELRVIDANYKDEFESGYYSAIVNTLDFIQGSEVYIQSLDNN